MSAVTEFLTLDLPDRRLAYCHQRGQSAAGVLFLGGYRSDMTGSKASFLATACQQIGCSFTRFDYRGHGQSSGVFSEGTIGAWLDDSLAIFDRITAGPQILVGSSMGGWLGLLLALRRPERVRAFIGIAAAPDFTEKLVWDGLSPERKNMLQRDGFIKEDSPYSTDPDTYTHRLITEGRTHLLLDAPIPLSLPIRLLQGLKDHVVPSHWPQKIAANLAGMDVQTSYLRTGDHRLSQPSDLALLWRTTQSFL